MAGLIGMMVGGFLIVLLLALLWEKLLFSKVCDDPVTGKLSSVAASWLTCSFLAGWGMADGGPYAWRAFGIYLVPALVLAVLAYRRGSMIKREMAEEPASVFD